MSKTTTINYRGIFDAYLQQVKSARDPEPEMPVINDLEWNTVLQQKIFDFGGPEFKKCKEVIRAAHDYSINCLCEIIFHLQSVKHLFQCLNCSKLNENDRKICFVLQNLSTKELLIFKEVEDCNFWKAKGKEPPIIQKYMDEVNAPSCKYVYLIYDKAYLQVIGHNDNEADPGRGYNVYSIKWFFETYYGQDEYKRFKENLEYYIEAVKAYLGYIVIRALTPNAMRNFRRIEAQRLLTFNYEVILDEQIKGKNERIYSMPQEDFDAIREQFLSTETYNVILGNNDFSESFITAEWLYDSMKKAKAIDLTAIGISYFKAAEQLLYQLVCLHANEHRPIKKDYSFKFLEEFIELNTENIAKQCIDTSIGAMAVFYKDNLNILRNELSYKARKYIREFIFSFKDIRNGYSHKKNIQDWDTIEKIRVKTYEMLFLILGSQQFTMEDLKSLRNLPEIEYSDYYRLCEYIDYHAGTDIFFLDYENGEEKIVFGCEDRYKEIVEERYVRFSGVYFKSFDAIKQVLKFKKEDLPECIYLGKLAIAQTEKANFTTVKVEKIFENGRFVGPSIMDESFDY